MSIRSIPFYQSCHREGEARGDPLGTSKRRENRDASLETRWIATSLAPFPLAMTILFYFETRVVCITEFFRLRMHPVDHPSIKSEHSGFVLLQ
jgi:hypothetical protein